MLNTESDLFKQTKSDSLSNTLGVMKSAAVQMIANKYDREKQNENLTDFESSTNNLIRNANKSIENSDAILAKTTHQDYELKYDYERNQFKNKPISEYESYNYSQPTNAYNGGVSSNYTSEQNQNIRSGANSVNSSGTKQYRNVGLKNFSNTPQSADRLE